MMMIVMMMIVLMMIIVMMMIVMMMMMMMMMNMLDDDDELICPSHNLYVTVILKCIPIVSMKIDVSQPMIYSFTPVKWFGLLFFEFILKD